jgi:hypothetical protein
MHYNFTENNSNDNFETITANVSTIADILEDKGISWGTYQEDMPYSGYEGFSWVDPEQKTIMCASTTYSVRTLHATLYRLIAYSASYI